MVRTSSLRAGAKPSSQKRSCSEDEFVLDPFIGSGITDIAARFRRFVGYDPSPNYVALAPALLDAEPHLYDGRCHRFDTSEANPANTLRAARMGPSRARGAVGCPSLLGSPPGILIRALREQFLGSSALSCGSRLAWTPSGRRSGAKPSQVETEAPQLRVGAGNRCSAMQERGHT